MTKNVGYSPKNQGSLFFFSFSSKNPIFIMFLQKWVNNFLKYESGIWKNLLTFWHFTTFYLLCTTLKVKTFMVALNFIAPQRSYNTGKEYHTESHKALDWKGSWKNMLPNHPCHSQGHLSLYEISQTPIQTGFEQFQWCDIHNFSGHPVPVSCHIQSKKCLLYVQSNPYYHFQAALAHNILRTQNWP